MRSMQFSTSYQLALPRNNLLIADLILRSQKENASSDTLKGTTVKLWIKKHDSRNHKPCAKAVHFFTPEYINADSV